LGAGDQWLPTVYLPSCGELTLVQLYEAMVFLYEHAEEVKKLVFLTTAYDPIFN
jgi:hypothetical protein